MASHSATPEARRRAARKDYENHKEERLKQMRDNYYNKKGVRQAKLDKSKQRIYEEGTIRFIRRLFI